MTVAELVLWYTLCVVVGFVVGSLGTLLLFGVL